MMEKNIAEIAHEFYLKLVSINRNHTSSIIERGKIFKKIRDDKLYLKMGEDNFNDFLARPELGVQRSTAYSDIRIVEVYGNVSPFVLSNIGPKRLQMMLPLVTEKNKDEWLMKAETYSWKDFINEVRKARGKPEMEQAKVPSAPSAIPSSCEYKKLVKASPCLIPNCGKKSTSHHFPRTKGAGADEYKVIPLCEQHHLESQEGGSKWLWENRIWVFDWFYNNLVK